jgi:hypothetical protein
LSAYKEDLDLTQFIEQITLNAFHLIDYQQRNVTTHTSVVQLEQALSSIIFFRLNMPTIYAFSQKYIALLNENLIYYEDKIINDIVFLVVACIVFFTLVIIYQSVLLVSLNMSEQKILMLITRVSI